MNSCTIERLTNIDIAETRDDALIEQQQFDCRRATGEAFLQVMCVEVERLRSECLEGGPIAQLLRTLQIERPKTPGIVEGEPPSFICFDDEMVMLLNFAGIDPPATRHAEMEDQRVTPIRIDHAVLGSAPQSDNPPAGQPLAQIDWKGAPKIGPSRFYAGDSMAIEHALQAANGGLDFRKLRHCGRDMADGCQAR